MKCKQEDHRAVSLHQKKLSVVTCARNLEHGESRGKQTPGAPSLASSVYLESSESVGEEKYRRTEPTEQHLRLSSDCHP